MIQQQNTMTYDITSDDMEYNGMESKLTVQANNVGRCYCYIEMEYLLTCDVSTKAKQCMEWKCHSIRGRLLKYLIKYSKQRNIIDQ